MPQHVLKDKDRLTIIRLSEEEDLNTREITEYFHSIGRNNVKEDLVRKTLNSNGHGRHKMKREKKALVEVAKSVDIDLTEDDSLEPLMLSILNRKLEVKELQYPESPAERLDFFIIEAEKLAHKNRHDTYMYGMSIAVYEKLLNLRSKFEVPVETQSKNSININIKVL